MKNILGNVIKSLREEQKLNQLELSKILNISNTTLSQYETGQRIPSDEIKEKIADFFNVSIDYLLGRTQYRSLDKSQINPAYFRIMKEAEEKGIPPEDIEDAIMLLERARKRDEDAKRRKDNT